SCRSSPVLEDASRQSTVKTEPAAEGEGESIMDETAKTTDSDQSALKHEDTHDSSALFDGEKNEPPADGEGTSQSNVAEGEEVKMETKEEEEEKKLTPEPVGPPAYEQVCDA